MTFQFSFSQNESPSMIDIFGEAIPDDALDVHLCSIVEEEDVKLWKMYCWLPIYQLSSVSPYNSRDELVTQYMKATGYDEHVRFGLVRPFPSSGPIISHELPLHEGSPIKVVWFSQNHFLTGFTIDGKPSYLIKNEDEEWEIHKEGMLHQGGFLTLDEAMISFRLIGEQRKLFK